MKRRFQGVLLISILCALFQLFLIPANLMAEEHNSLDDSVVKPDTVHIRAFINITNLMLEDYCKDSNDSLWMHIDSANAILECYLDTVLYDALHLMIGLLYVKSDSLDQAIIEYDKISIKSEKLAAFLMQKIISTPQGFNKYYPDFPSSEFTKIFSSITPIMCEDIVDKDYFDYCNPIFGNARPVGWGCFVNKQGDLITTSNKFYEIDRAITGVFALTKLSDVLSKMIGDEYVLVSVSGFSRMLKTTPEELLNIKPAKIIDPDNLVGDTIVIIQSPYLKSSKIGLGVISNLSSDPLTGQVIEIQAFDDLNRSMAIVVTLKAELIGMISTVRTNSDNYVYAFPVNKLTKFRFKNRRAVPKFTKDLRKLGEKYSSNQNALNYLAAGKLNLWRGYSESAFEMFEKAIELGPDLALPYLYCGFCKWQLEDFDEAESFFLSAYEKDNELDDSYYNLGLMFLQQERFKEAEKAFRKANKINSKNPYTLYELGKYYLVHGKKSDVKKICRDLKWLDENLAEELKNQI